MAGRQKLAVFMLAIIEGTVLFRRVLLSSESSLALSVGNVSFLPEFFSLWMKMSCPRLQCRFDSMQVFGVA